MINENAKLCVDCKHCEVKEWGEHICLFEPLSKNVVTGSLSYSTCETMRKSSCGTCGPDAVLWVPKGTPVGFADRLIALFK